jgi:hypothetical protein
MTRKLHADARTIHLKMGEAIRNRSFPIGRLPERLLKLLCALDQPNAVIMPADRRKAEKRQGPKMRRAPRKKARR